MIVTGFSTGGLSGGGDSALARDFALPGDFALAGDFALTGDFEIFGFSPNCAAAHSAALIFCAAGELARAVDGIRGLEFSTAVEERFIGTVASVDASLLEREALRALRGSDDNVPPFLFILKTSLVFEDLQKVAKYPSSARTISDFNLARVFLTKDNLSTFSNLLYQNRFQYPVSPSLTVA